MRNIIKFIRRKNLKKNKPLSIIYDICVVRKSSHKRRVLEKLGTYSISGKSLTLNIFRLCF